MNTWFWSTAFLAVTALVIALVAWRLRAEALRARREQAIRGHVFSGSLFDKLCARHPQLTLKDCHLVARALRTFFLAYLKSGGRGSVGMPSRVVDDLWHEFILDTRGYARFCQQAFGRYFHHVPAAKGGRGGIDEGLRATWRWACLEENINPQRPTRMPLLFALDDKLRIAGGQHFSLPQQVALAAGGARESHHGGSSSSSSDTIVACSGGGLIGEAASGGHGSHGGHGGHGGHDGGGHASSDSSSSDGGGSSCSGGSSCGGGCGGGGGD